MIHLSLVPETPVASFTTFMPQADQPSKPTRRRHARGTAAESRQELLDAAIKILQKDGAGALSTVSITRSAGFTQSAFYQHFADVDECLREVAQHVASRIRTFVVEHRRQAHQPSVSDESLTDHFRVMLELFERERVFTELFLRHRRDSSNLGKVMRRLHRDLCSDLIEHLRLVAQASGVDIPAERLQLYAELILAQVLAGGEAVLDRRLAPASIAEELTRFILGAMRAAIDASSRPR
jgi:AcrR family transcriptional regulator